MANSLETAVKILIGRQSLISSFFGIGNFDDSCLVFDFIELRFQFQRKHCLFHPTRFVPFLDGKIIFCMFFSHGYFLSFGNILSCFSHMDISYPLETFFHVFLTWIFLILWKHSFVFFSDDNEEISLEEKLSTEMLLGEVPSSIDQHTSHHEPSFSAFSGVERKLTISEELSDFYDNDFATINDDSDGDCENSEQFFTDCFTKD